MHGSRKQALNPAELASLMRKALDARLISRGIRFRIIPVPNRQPPNWTADWQGTPSPVQVEEAEAILTELQGEFDLRAP